MKLIRSLLVLAEHPQLVEGVRAALRSPGDRLIHRTTLEHAEPFLATGSVNAVIYDWESNPTRAFWVLERVRQMAPGCPVIVVAEEGHRDWEEEAYLKGAAHVLARPLRPRLFNALLDRCLESASDRSPRPMAPGPVPSGLGPRLEDSGPQIGTLEILRDFSAILSHSLCAESMLKQFLLLLRGILGVNRAAIFLLRPGEPGGADQPGRSDGEVFETSCLIGLAPGLLEGFSLSPDWGLGAFLSRQGRILRRDSIEAMQDVVVQREFDLLGAQVAVPMLDRERLVGIATFDGRLTGEPLGNTELQLIFHLLEHLGLAVRNIRLHDQLAANHEMMADVLRHLRSACVVVGRDLKVLHFNKTAKQLFGKSTEIGLDFSEIPEALGSKVYQVLKNGTGIAPFKHEPAEAPGTVFRVTVLPLRRTESATTDSVLLVVEDLTQSEQLQKLEIETANLRLIRAMADRMAHEIGNAMVPLSTHQQLLAERYKDAEFRASLATAMADGVKRVERLVNQMRFLARDTVASEEPLALAPLIEEAYRDALRHQSAKSPKLMIEASQADATVLGDRMGLRHAFSELLLNALQANPAEARVVVHIKEGGHAVGTARKGNGHAVADNGHAPDTLEVDISDNGGGFSAEAAKVVPKPFFTTRNVGLGLGMTVSRKIFECHGARLSLAPPSETHHGTVRISFPATRVRTKEQSAARSPMNPAPAS